MLERRLSVWRSITNGVPRGSVLGSLAFIIRINDLDMNLGGLVNKLDYDTTIGIVDSKEVRINVKCCIMVG